MDAFVEKLKEYGLMLFDAATGEEVLCLNPNDVVFRNDETDLRRIVNSSHYIVIENQKLAASKLKFPKKFLNVPAPYLKLMRLHLLFSGEDSFFACLNSSNPLEVNVKNIILEDQGELSVQLKVIKLQQLFGNKDPLEQLVHKHTNIILNVFPVGPDYSKSKTFYYELLRAFSDARHNYLYN